MNAEGNKPAGNTTEIKVDQKELETALTKVVKALLPGTVAEVVKKEVPGIVKEELDGKIEEITAREVSKYVEASGGTVNQFFSGVDVWANPNTRITPKREAITRLAEEGITYTPEFNALGNGFDAIRPGFIITMTNGQQASILIAVPNSATKGIVWLREGEFTVTGLTD